VRRVQGGWQSKVQDVQRICQKQSSLEIPRMPRQAINKRKLSTVLVSGRKGANLSFYVVDLSGIVRVHTPDVVESDVGGIALQRGKQACPGRTPSDLQMVFRGLNLPEGTLDISRIPQSDHRVHIAAEIVAIGGYGKSLHCLCLNALTGGVTLCERDLKISSVKGQ